VILNVALGLLGAALLLVGLWLVWPPLALIAAGAALLTVAFLREVPDGPTPG
jgi:hypothetical protein